MLKTIGFSHDMRVASHDAQYSSQANRPSNFPEWQRLVSINNAGER